MARRVFFSFHYALDIWRANVVRNHWVTQGFGETGVLDASLWEEAKAKTDTALKRIINKGLENTTVTVVLIGAETHERRWIKYEILRSLRRKNAIVALNIDQIKNQDGQTCRKGKNPLSDIVVNYEGKRVKLSSVCPVYDWVKDDGFKHIGDWVERAAKEEKYIQPTSYVQNKGPRFPQLSNWVKNGDDTGIPASGSKKRIATRRSGMNG